MPNALRMRSHFAKQPRSSLSSHHTRADIFLKFQLSAMRALRRGWAGKRDELNMSGFV